MTDPQVAMLMLSLFIFLVLLGFPIAFTLIAMGVGFGYYAYFQADNLFNNQIFYYLTKIPILLWKTMYWLPYLYFYLWVMWLNEQIL